MTNYKYITDFHKSRQSLVGASDIPCLIPNPNNSTESLASFTKDGKRIVKTAQDLYNEKVNGKDYDYSFAADMGHFLEPKVLYEFIKDNIDKDVANEFYRGYQLHSLETELQSQKAGKKVCVNPVPFNTTPFRHNTEVVNDFGVAHADCVFDPKEMNVKILQKNMATANKDGSILYKKNNITIDLSKPFLIEAKSANYFSANARKHDQYKGYDLSLKEWQGIPLSHYLQIQYQLLLYNIDVSYLALIYNTNEKRYWTIKSNKKHQQELQQIAEYMKKCIDTKTPPKQLAMNQKDIVKLYPTIEDDFVEITGEQLHHVIDSAKKYYAAKKQVKVWQAKEQEHKESMAIHLKDVKVAKGIVNGVMVDLCRYKITKSSQRLCGLKAINERDEKEAKRIMNYLKRKKLINKSDESRSAQICIKEKDLEVLE